MSYFLNETNSNNELAAAIESREFEIANYQKNEAILQAIIAGYSELGDWPERLFQFRNVADSRVLAEQLSGADLELAGKLQHRDRTVIELNMNQIECRKAQAIMDALIGSVSIEQLAAIIATYKASK